MNGLTFVYFLVAVNAVAILFAIYGYVDAKRWWNRF
jgi:hypothetical protein